MNSATDKEVFCYDDLSSRCLGNVALIERVVSAFTNGAQNDLQVLRDAIHDEDLPLVGKTAHRIKGSAANVAAYRMSTYAATLERDAKNEEAKSLNELCVQILESFEDFLDASQSIETPPDSESNVAGTPPKTV